MGIRTVVGATGRPPVNMTGAAGDATEAGHVDIREDEGEFFGMRLKQGNCLHAIAAAHDAITMVPEGLREDVAEGYIVVHHEDEFAMAVGTMKRRCADWLG